jgi:hypothetical protein
MTDQAQPFEHAKLKIRWANGHIYKIIDQYRAFLDSDLAEMSIERDGVTGKQVLKISDPTEFPPMIALIVGDAIHNLRTAFDYITVAVTGKDWMALPVGKTRDDIVSKSNHYRAINPPIRDSRISSSMRYSLTAEENLCCGSFPNLIVSTSTG